MKQAFVKTFNYFIKQEKPLQQVVLLLLASGGLLGFIEVAEEVGEGETHAIDTRIILFFRNPNNVSDPIGPLWFEEFVRDVTAFGSFAFILMASLFTVGLLLVLNKYKMALFTAVSILSGSLLSFALKLGFDRPRPGLVPHHTEVITKSFPSGHSMMAVITFLTLATLASQTLRTRKAKTYLISSAAFIALLVGFTRIYLGVHWPSDVLAGFLMGTFWALMSSFVALRLSLRH